MTTFVVLAAGRGSRLGRLGDELHKCLVPLDGQAVLSRQFALAPHGARLVVVVGYRADQVREYVRLAHPSLDVTFVDDERWGAGPGVSLLAARDAVGDDDMIWTACDTLWEQDDTLAVGDSSWLAVAPIPAGTPAARWCRAVPDATGQFVAEIHDKTPDVVSGSLASTAFARIVREDLDAFWTGLLWAETRSGEVQLSNGLEAILKSGNPLEIRHIDWLDVGDEAAYRSAQATLGVYDPVKIGQTTYVLHDESRVVKFNADPDKIRWRYERAERLGTLIPRTVEPVGRTMFGYELVQGTSAYQAIIKSSRGLFSDVAVTRGLLEWWRVHFLDVVPDDVQERYVNIHDTTVRFYRDKTMSRVMSLDLPLQSQALDAITRINWDDLARGSMPGEFHGDFTYSNIIVTDAGTFVAIDWREDFAGQSSWGDLRYDMGKLLASTVFNWERASRGDFRRDANGTLHGNAIRRFVRDRSWSVRDIEIIGALCLIGSAALHAAPMDEILIARGCRWLGEFT